MIDDSWTFCRRILPRVSRSFALIIPRCPPPIDRALCVAYLICRIADTIEDEAALSSTQRDALYDALLLAVDEPRNPARTEKFIRAWPAIPEGDYGQLVGGTVDVLAAFASLPPDCHPPIRVCVRDMVAGMRATAAADTRAGINFLCRDLAELDDYCHFVAGTVGIMSTALFESHIGPAGLRPTDAWREQGRRMGLGLQMTNIIKDCRVDAGRGVSFIPARFVDLSDGSYRLHPAGRSELIRHAIGHLDEAMRYVMAIPRHEQGIRTFLLGSLLPAIATLEVAAPGHERQPKITRGRMTEILALIDESAHDDAAVSAWYEAVRARARDLLHPLPVPGGDASVEPEQNH